MPQRKTGHVTLSDVARATGFSVSTVSITLSEAPLSANVASSTREVIRQTAARLGYHPDARARSLRKRNSGTIGVLAFDLSDPFCMPVFHGIQAGLRETEYLPLVMDARTERKVFDQSLRLMLERRVEGVVVIASWIFDESGLLADVQKNSVPMIIVGRDMTESNITSYLLDNEAGGAMAMNHLLQLGHRRIAVIRGPDEMFDSAPRWNGVLHAAQALGVTVDARLTRQLPSIGTTKDAFESGRGFAQELVQQRREFTAVLAFDDMTALGVVRGLSEAGIRVPEQCSVVGFDDVLPARVATPAITTIRQPMETMGQQASEWMLSLLQHGTASPQAKRVACTPELVARASSAAASGSKSKAASGSKSKAVSGRKSKQPA